MSELKITHVPCDCDWYCDCKNYELSYNGIEVHYRNESDAKNTIEFMKRVAYEDSRREDN